MEMKNEFSLGTYFKKWGTSRRCGLVVPKIQTIIWSFTAGFLGILLLSYIAFEKDLFILFAPFGASAVLLYGACSAPFSQPRNLIGGHLIAALTGVLLWHLMGMNFVSVALAVSLSIVLMLLTRTVHPPAGATALLGVTSSQGSFWWILSPIGIGVLLLLVVALLVNNMDPEKKYPEYWL